MKTNLIYEMAEWVDAVRFEDIPEGVIDKAKIQVLNNIAASFAGVLSNGAKGILNLMERAFSNRGDSTIFVKGARTSPFAAVFANSSFSMTFDFDDYLFLGHTGHSSVFVPLALSEELNKTGKDSLLATIIANEIEGRIGGLVVLGPHNGQMWSFIHAVGAACAAGKLLGLSKKAIADAIGTSLYQPNFPLWPGFMGPDSKILTASVPAITGLISAFLAADGFSGSHSLMNHPRGFLRHFSYEPLKFMMSGLGESWVTDSLAFKIYPGCAYIDTTMDALFMALEQAKNKMGRKIEPEEIKNIEVRANILTVGMEAISREFLRDDRIEAININFSIPYNVALGIISGRLTPEELRQDNLDRNESLIRSLAKKVTLRHAPEMSLKVVESFLDFGLTGRIIRDIGISRIPRLRRRIQEQMGKKIDVKILDTLVIFNGILKRGLRGFYDLFRREPGRGDLSKVNFADFKLPFPASVKIRLTDGMKFFALQEVPFGAGSDSEQARRVEKKFREEAGRAGIKNAEEMIKVFRTLDKSESVKNSLNFISKNI